MKYSEFCHWLNGFFELNEPTKINEQQVELIKKHIDMVMVHEKGAVPLCSFLKGYFKISGITEVNEEHTQIIKQELDNTFKNELDLSNFVSNMKSNNTPKQFDSDNRMRC